MDGELTRSNDRNLDGGPATAAESVGPAAALAPRTVLVACSEPHLAEALERVLRTYEEDVSPTGLLVRRVHDGLSCLQELELAPPDLLVLHLRLDKLSAAEVLRSHSTAHAERAIAVLPLTSLPGEELPPELGCPPALSVPFDNGQLVERAALSLIQD